MLKHIIKSQQFTLDSINHLFQSADYIENNPYHSYDLKGKIAATLFYEPSTRTRLSFESAMLRMGGQAKIAVAVRGAILNWVLQLNVPLVHFSPLDVNKIY